MRASVATKEFVDFDSEAFGQVARFGPHVGVSYSVGFPALNPGALIAESCCASCWVYY